MTAFMRNVHRIAIGAHAAAVVLFAWAYSVLGSPAWLLFAGWSCFWGALSVQALRSERKGVRA